MGSRARKNSYKLFLKGSIWRALFLWKILIFFTVTEVNNNVIKILICSTLVRTKSIGGYDNHPIKRGKNPFQILFT